MKLNNIYEIKFIYINNKIFLFIYLLKKPLNQLM